MVYKLLFLIILLVIAQVVILYFIQQNVPEEFWTTIKSMEDLKKIWNNSTKAHAKNYLYERAYTCLPVLLLLSLLFIYTNSNGVMLNLGFLFVIISEVIIGFEFYLYLKQVMLQKHCHYLLKYLRLIKNNSQNEKN